MFTTQWMIVAIFDSHGAVAHVGELLNAGASVSRRDVLIGRCVMGKGVRWNSAYFNRRKDTNTKSPRRKHTGQARITGTLAIGMAGECDTIMQQAEYGRGSHLLPLAIRGRLSIVGRHDALAYKSAQMEGKCGNAETETRGNRIQEAAQTRNEKSCGPNPPRLQRTCRGPLLSTPCTPVPTGVISIHNAEA